MYEHVLVTVAPGKVGDQSKVFEIARKLLAPNGKLSVLSVVEQVPTHVYVYLPNNYYEDSVSGVKADLEKELEVPEEDIHVHFGQAANSILQWSEEADVDCVLIKSHQPELSDFLLGSTAAKVVRHAKCSVHVIR